MANAPYISLIIAGRDDDYGGFSQERFASCLAHLHHQLGSGEDLFEIVVCDWNPPAPEKLLSTSFDWSAFDQVRFVVVPPDIHASYAGDSGYPILDYIARNAAIRRSEGQFVGVINQDIYLSDGIAKAIQERSFDPNHFYRADRCGFRTDLSPRGMAMTVEMYARCFEINRRHGPGLHEKITNEMDEGMPTEDWPVSFPAFEEILSPDGALAVMNPLRAATLRREMKELKQEMTFEKLVHLIGIHTNASGDFVIATKEAFGHIHGFSESKHFYMHTDAYGIVQLFAGGFNQALFLHPNGVFHADHDRGGRAGRKEGMEWPAHDERLGRIMMGREDFRLNGPDWGLRDYDLPIECWRRGERVWPEPRKQAVNG